MFSFEAFTIFFWSLAAVIVLMLVFEDKLLKLEAKMDKKKVQPKSAPAKKPVAAKAVRRKGSELQKRTCTSKMAA